MNYILSFIFFIQLITAIPLPQPPVVVVTHYSTAPTLYKTKTYITGTTTVYLPPVGIIIDGDNTITSTLTEAQWNTYPYTFTSVVQRDQVDPTPTPSPAPAPAPEPTTTTTPTPPAPAAESSSSDPAPKTTSASTDPVAQPTSSSADPAPQATSSTIDPPASSSSSSAATPESSSAVTPESSSAVTPESSSAASIPSLSSAAPSSSSSSAHSVPESSASSTSQAPSSSSSSSTTDPASPSTTSSSGTNPAPAPSGTSLTDDIAPPTGIVYSPYANDGGCKSSDQIVAEMKQIANKGIKNIRSYGTDCHSIDVMLPTAIELGMSVNQGVWISQDGVDSIDSQVQQLIDYGSQNGWGVFQFITIGNEAINSNFCTVDQLISKISSVKSQLRKAGYNGQVTTAEPPIQFIQNPQLCTDSDIDIVSINPHSYFNENIAPADAGAYIMEQKGQVVDICSGKPVDITETGYPSQGMTNGVNVPTPQNQDIAIKSIISATGGDCTILTAFDDFWKEPGPYGIEQSFGVLQLFQ
ncbi:uncharacterized protein SPAPADRAFT_61263 [Spathaspora passalidarum NRRL Y-27907]|uniref:Glycoside hydrolase family 17 protein n=1 Tax=Spathaspora passalidarum (strain NRRL Y-27907 / 11-Y1) TaxID=619300 RepID=G3APK4_SPAPN|nr:uncharacterized protein SPAPADRAFT_61263 [Spathaspora passalidarum NRRL Y-27907]EGW32175.1 hypothetical protein SPAPADRAFT_61263 [Spathaspora passalidarum NRRL Y-27907]